MDGKSARKRAEAFAATFEKECREGVTSDSRLKFEEYCSYVIGLKEQRGIKHSTIVRYAHAMEAADQRNADIPTDVFLKKA